MSAQVSNSGNMGGTVTNISQAGGAQVLNVGSQLGNAGNVMVNSSVRTLPPTVRVLPPLSHHNSRPGKKMMTFNLVNFEKTCKYALFFCWTKSHSSFNYVTMEQIFYSIYSFK